MDETPYTGSKDRRAGGGRRELDIKMERQIKALQLGQTAMTDLLSQQGNSLREHLTKCSNDSDNLRAAVDSMKAVLDKIAVWASPQIKRAQDWAILLKKVKEAVLTETMVWLIRGVIIATLLAIASGLVPAGRAYLAQLAAAALAAP